MEVLAWFQYLISHEKSLYSVLCYDTDYKLTDLKRNGGRSKYAIVHE